MSDQIQSLDLSEFPKLVPESSKVSSEDIKQRSAALQHIRSLMEN